MYFLLFLLGQFNSPHGFCLGLDEDIVVADTNNHRIQVDKHKYIFVIISCIAIYRQLYNSQLLSAFSFLILRFSIKTDCLSSSLVVLDKKRDNYGDLG